MKQKTANVIVSGDDGEQLLDNGVLLDIVSDSQSTISVRLEGPEEIPQPLGHYTLLCPMQTKHGTEHSEI